MEDVRPPFAVDLDVPRGGAGGEVVGAKELRVREPRAPADSLLDELGEAAVAVRETPAANLLA